MFVFLDNPLKQRLFCGTRCKDMLARVCILTNGARRNRRGTITQNQGLTDYLTSLLVALPTFCLHFFKL